MEDNGAVLLLTECGSWSEVNLTLPNIIKKDIICLVYTQVNKVRDVVLFCTVLDQLCASSA